MKPSQRLKLEGSFLTEVYEQPSVLGDCLAYYRDQETKLRHVLGREAPASVVFTGMGASLYASLPAVYYLYQRGIAAHALETAELVCYALPTLMPRDVLVLISQSGETAEIRRLLSRLPRRHPRLIAVTNHPASTLGRRADLVLPIHAGEQHFASSKTYAASLFVALLLATLWGEGSLRRLLEGLAQSLDTYRRVLIQAHEQAVPLARIFRKPGSVVLLGRGPGLASALEGALLFKEVCALPAEGMTAAALRHGPLELLSRPLTAILFAPPGFSRPLNRSLGRDLERHRARLLWISSTALDLSRTRSFRLPRLTVPELLPVFEIVPLQCLTWALAEQLGREPGRLRIASNVTLTE